MTISDQSLSDSTSGSESESNRQLATKSQPGSAAGPTLESALDKDDVPETGNLLSKDTVVGVIIVALSACVLFFTDLGTFPLFNPDEALYAEPAREMLVTGEYVTTLLNYVVRYTKPPLVIWAMALSYKIFGVNEFAARLFGASCGVLLIAASYLFCLKYANRRTAIITAFVLATSPLYIGTGREAITDMPLSLFVGGALMAFFHGFVQRRKFWLVLAYALTGLAVMTKGPVAVVLPGAILFAYHLLRGDLKEAFRRYMPIAGAFIVAAIALPWFVIEIYKTHGDYFQSFIMVENLQRFVSVVDHKAPWWYHLAVVMGGLFPWSVFLFPGFARAFRWAPGSATKGLGDRARQFVFSLPQGPYRTISFRQRFMLFAGCTAAVIVTFFSLSVSKLVPYTLPAFPALAMLIAATIDQLIDERRSKIFAILFGCMAVTCIGAFGGLPIVQHKLRDCPAELMQLLPFVLGTLAVAAAVATALAAKRKIMPAVTVLSLMIVFSFVSYGFRILRICAHEWEMPLVAFTYKVRDSGLPIIVYHMRKPSVTFYAKKPVLMPTVDEDYEKDLVANPKAYILARTRDQADFAGRPGMKLVEKRGRYILFSWDQGHLNPEAGH